MKTRLHLAAAFAAILALCACGGGGAGNPAPIPVVRPTPTPTTSPTTAPPATYAVKVTFQGGASLRSGGASSASVTTFARTMDLATDPIVISNPPPSGSMFGSVGDVQDSGVATVTVSPMPATSPSVSFDVAGVDVTATPVPSPAAGIAQAHVDAQPSATPAAGTFTVNLTGSVVASTTTNTYTVNRANVLCNSASMSSYPASDMVAGVAFHDGVAVAVSDPSDADLSITGPWCDQVAGFQTSETDPTLHCPHGCVLYSSADVHYWNLTPAMWSNAVTSVDLVTWQQQATAPNGDDLIVLKTGDGPVVRVGVNSFSAGTPPQPGFNSSPASVNFLYEEDGFSPLGF